MEAEELIAELKDYAVTDVKNIYVTIDGSKKKTAIMIITFARTELPEKIRAGFPCLRVERFIPNPLKCFKCQRFGHSQISCKREAVCAKCCLKAHGDEACTREPQ